MSISDPGKIATSRKLLFLDGLRGLAAIYVMIGHARWLLWEGYSGGYLKNPEQYGSLDKMLMYFFAMFRYGHEMVLFFFVLSGFVIHLKYAQQLQNTGTSRFAYVDYVLKRIRRIYPPFVFAILLTLALDNIGKELNFAIYSGATGYAIIDTTVGTSNWEVQTLLGNLAFLFENYVPFFGSNGPAWSLKYEWWFYMLYPLFLIIGTRNIIYPTLLIVILFLASFFPQVWPEKLFPDIFSKMITWWLGVMLAEIYTGRVRIKLKYLGVVAAMVLFLPWLNIVNNVLYDLSVAVFFFGVLAAFLSLPDFNRFLRLIEKFKVFGDFSYTLYITHFPILVFFAGWIMHKSENKLPSHFLFVFAGIAVTTVLAYFFHFITELPFITGKNVKSFKPQADTVSA